MNSENEHYIVVEPTEPRIQLDTYMSELRMLTNDMYRLIDKWKEGTRQQITALDGLVNQCQNQNMDNPDFHQQTKTLSNNCYMLVQQDIIFQIEHFKKMVTHIQLKIEQIFNCLHNFEVGHIVKYTKMRYDTALLEYLVFKRKQLNRNINERCNRTPYSYGTRGNY